MIFARNWRLVATGQVRQTFWYRKDTHWFEEGKGLYQEECRETTYHNIDVHAIDYEEYAGRSILEIGHSYAIQPAANKPAVWMNEVDDEHAYGTIKDYYFAHEICDLDSDITNWAKAQIEPFLVDNKPNAKCWLLNRGYDRMGVKIASIEPTDIRNITDKEAVQEGYDNAMDLLVRWAKKHDWLAGLKYVGTNNFGHDRWVIFDPDAYSKECQAGEGTIKGLLNKREGSPYRAWRIEFKAVVIE